MKVLLDDHVSQVTKDLFARLIFSICRLEVCLDVHVFSYVRTAQTSVDLGLDLQVRLVLGDLLRSSKAADSCSTTVPPALLLLLDSLQASLLVVCRRGTLALTIVEEVVLVLRGLHELIVFGYLLSVFFCVC